MDLRARRAWRRFAGPAVILLAAAVAIVPQLIRGNSCGHDFDVHLVSWLDCLNAWRHGIPYPHWTPSANYGAGEPRFVFYPPLTWMLGAALGAILPWNLVPIALTFLILGRNRPGHARAGPRGARRSARHAGRLRSHLLRLHALHRLRALRLPRIRRRILAPAAASFCLCAIVHPSASLVRRARFAIFDGSTAPLAIALAGAWLSNLPLGVMAGYLLAGVALLWAIVNKSWAPLLRAAVATVLGLGLAAIYWVPAAFERHWVDIRQATEDPGYNFENNWLFSHHANPLLALHDVVLHQVSMDRRLHDRRRARRRRYLLLSATHFQAQAKPGGFRSPPFPSSFCFFCFPFRGRSGTCCLKCLSAVSLALA